MAEKPTYEELEKRVKELEKEPFMRKRLEEAKTQSADRFRLVFERSNDAIIVHQVGKIKDVNQRASELVGYTREQLLNMSVLDLFPEEYHETIKDRLKKSVRAGATVFETKWKRADGELIDVEVNSGDFDTEEGIRFGITRDITERKKAEQALRESEERFRKIFEDGPLGVVLTSRNLKLFSVNPTFCRMLGYTPEEMNIRTFLDVTHPEHRSADRESVEKMWQGELPYYKTVKRYIAKNGDIRWGSLSSSLIRGPEGDPIYALAMIEDITERKEAEEALRESEKKFRRFFEDDLTGDYITTADGIILDCNPAFLRIFGYKSKAEAVGESITELYPKVSERGSIIDQLRVTGKLENFKTTRKRKDGILITVNENIVATLDQDRNPVEIKGYFYDITERTQAEEALRESEKKFRDLYEEAPVGYMEFDTEGRITNINKKQLEMFGYTAEEMMGKSVWSFVREKEKSQELIEAKLAGDRPPSKNLERTYVRKDGATFPGLIEDVLLKDKTGRIIGIRSIIQDITERKRAEDRLRESEEKLTRFKKMESLGLLAGGVAHDLNNVLAGIVSYPELLLLDLPDDSKFRKPIQTIQEAGNRATAIVQDLLTVARGVASTKETLNLNNIIKEYLTSPEFQKLEQFHPTITVKTDLDTDILNMRGSRIHISKVIMNLVSNASEAIEGSGNVIISTMNRYVDRPIRRYEDVKIGEYAVLAVSDDGSGILSKHLERIFEPFFTKKVMGRSGTGLGLAVVWNIVQDHEAYIDVLSGEKGTTFEIYFPITRGEVTEKDQSISLEDYKGDGETILVVDDIESQREITCNMLDVLGYKSIAVSSGEEAVEYLKKHSVDLILLDMIMDPGMNGRETYEKIIKIHPNQKAVIVSGFAETDEVKEAQKLGAGQYIRKPLTLERIGTAIKEELVKS